jgi:hypothetical protein
LDEVRADLARQDKNALVDIVETLARRAGDVEAVVAVMKRDVSLP